MHTVPGTLDIYIQSVCFISESRFCPPQPSSHALHLRAPALPSELEQSRRTLCAIHHSPSGMIALLRAFFASCLKCTEEDRFEKGKCTVVFVGAPPAIGKLSVKQTKMCSSEVGNL